MRNFVFNDCEYRFEEDYTLFCKNKKGYDLECDNCMENIHLNCSNFNLKRDFCLKFFRGNISELKECAEKSVFSDDVLSKKWSN